VTIPTSPSLQNVRITHEGRVFATTGSCMLAICPNGRNLTFMVTESLPSNMENGYKIQIQIKTPPLSFLNHENFVKFSAHKGQKNKTDGEISCFFWRVKNMIHHVLRNWQ
jgi:hypothetical protein